MGDCNDFTETETAILTILGDGRPHRRAELLECLPGSKRLTALQMHISNIRKRLRPKGYDVICELASGTIHYRWARTLGKA